MRELERRFPREIAIIGVSSGKFIAERETPRIREAALRLGNDHPIINDRQFRIWRSYAVRAWPTIVAVDPAGYVAGVHAGEFTAPMFEPFIEQQIGAFEIDRTERHYPLDEPAVAPGILRYPGKVTVDGDRMAIADTGHDRVLVGRLGGRGFEITRTLDSLHAPEGVAFAGERLYIADREANRVLVADLSSGAVDTLTDRVSSPWDLTVVGSTIYVAGAGRHQIWRIEGTHASLYAGAPGEDIVDGPAKEALLAQPMGIARGNEGVDFVDAESSAVRTLTLGADPAVSTIVGTGLFDFGDTDGVGDQVRLQHCQGIARHPDGRLIVADSYNDALKWVDPATRRVETWVRGLAEPSGVAYAPGRVYVADTNAHRIAVVDETTGRIDTLALS